MPETSGALWISDSCVCVFGFLYKQPQGWSANSLQVVDIFTVFNRVQQIKLKMLFTSARMSTQHFEVCLEKLAVHAKNLVEQSRAWCHPDVTITGGLLFQCRQTQNSLVPSYTCVAKLNTDPHLNSIIWRSMSRKRVKLQLWPFKGSCRTKFYNITQGEILYRRVMNGCVFAACDMIDSLLVTSPSVRCPISTDYCVNVSVSQTHTHTQHRGSPLDLPLGRCARKHTKQMRQMCALTCIWKCLCVWVCVCVQIQSIQW